MRRLLRQFRNIRKLLILSGFLSIISALLLLVTSSAMGCFTTDAALKPLDFLLKAGLSLTGLYAVKACFDKLVYCHVISQIQTKSYSMLASAVYDKILSLPLLDQKRADGDELYTLMQSDAEKASSFFSDTMPGIIDEGIRLIAVFAYITLLSPVIAIAYFGIMAAAVLIEKKLGTIVEKESSKAKDAEIMLNGSLDDVLANRLIIRTYQKEDFADNTYQPLGKDYRMKSLQIDKAAMVIKTIGIVCGMLPIFSIMVCGLYMIPRHMISLSSFLSIYYVCQYVVISQLHYTDLISAASKAKVSLNRLADFLEYKPEEITPVYDASGYQLDSINYHYPDSRQNVLRNISFSVQKGEKVTLTGPSGCGKSTLLKILAGMSVPSEGSCRIQHSVYLQQFPFFFDDTIRNNLTNGNIYSDAEIRKALETACISDMNNRLDEKLVNNASNLSGGQQQRLAIARAVLQKSEAYLFDESLSACDNVTAEKILQNLLAEFPESTMIFVLHQEQLVSRLDRIIEMKQGAVICDSSSQFMRKGDSLL